MAIVTLTILAGRDHETKRRLHAALAEAVMRELPAKPGHVRTVIQEVTPVDYAVGGVTIDRMPPDPA
jgi:4-oxalocrotonate tautomerase family enzyme